MCGFFFCKAINAINVDQSNFANSFQKMKWRGVNFSRIENYENGRVAIGHHRLKILDLSDTANQPMTSTNNRYTIAFNGEIYNHQTLRIKFGLHCKTQSDTETILEGYQLIGESFFSELDGMFSFIIYDHLTSNWVAARDPFGIKPLWSHASEKFHIICSEPSVIASFIGDEFDQQSFEEWEIIRRPIPGKSFFKKVTEVLPGQVLHSNGQISSLWSWQAEHATPFNQEELENILSDSIKSHTLSDVDIVSLLSGGIDSAIISKIASIKKSYTVGLDTNNEFKEAATTAKELSIQLKCIDIDQSQLIALWKKLTKLRGEPLSLPNEALIYAACHAMDNSEIVVLTGEGADELFCGYDRIFRWAATTNEPFNITNFLIHYGYSDRVAPERLLDFLSDFSNGLTTFEVVEDFFYRVHLPCLLRRMDFASMAAFKEARVPFVTKSLIAYNYRRPFSCKVLNDKSKIPLRIFSNRLGLASALSRKKIGFSANFSQRQSTITHYKYFRNIVLEALQ